MTLAAAVPLNRDLRVISLIGVAHGFSHYYQLAFVTMLLIVRRQRRAQLRRRRHPGRHLLCASRAVAQTARASRSTASARGRSWPAGLPPSASRLRWWRSRIRSPASPRSPSWRGLGNCVFHPADFALLNASVDPAGSGRPSASMAWAARSAGRRPRAVLPERHVRLGRRRPDRRHPGPGAGGAGMGASRRARRPSHQGRAPPPRRQAQSPLALFLQPPILLCLVLFRPVRRQHRRHPAVRRAGIRLECSASARPTRRSA